MKESTRSDPVGFIRLTVPLLAKDHRAYRRARILLKRIMGRKAPAVLTLILHDLQARDARGIADDYLDTVGWPRTEGRTVSLQRRPSRALSTGRSAFRRTVFTVDPNRN